MIKKIIAVVNQKGGVGKTTTSINLATAFAISGHKILLIDLDPQGNASSGMGISQSQRELNIYHLLTDTVEAEKIINKTNVPNLDIITSTVDLSGAELELVKKLNREFVLKNKLENIKKFYDYIFIDCPPSLSLLTINALVFATEIFIPLQCEFFALEGLTHLLRTVSLVQKRLNTDLKILGVALTMYDRRYNLTSQVEEDVKSHLGDLVFNTVIPRNIRLSEAPSHGKPAMIYDLKCAGSLAYIKLAKEILEKDL